ncbi:PTS transporter subunit EIIC, partial [Clostridium perfringens]
LIPTGLHHALNSVFWFDVAGINDIGNFWGTLGEGVYGQTGMYMTGFFPVMMFGLPAGALAMYHTAKDKKKKAVAGLLLAAALSSFFTGVTEPLEFAFMFLAPGLYLVHAGLTGISAIVCTLLPVRSGFNFSAGFVDWCLSFKAPMAENPLWLIPIGLAFGVIY